MITIVCTPAFIAVSHTGSCSILLWHLDISDHHSVEQLQDKAVSELEKYCATIHPGDKNRFPRLLLLLSPLRSLHSETLEDLFFSGLIGNIQIDSVIPYILKMEPREYQNHLGVKAERESFSPEPASPASPVKQETESSLSNQDINLSSSPLKVEVNFISANDSQNLPENSEPSNPQWFSMNFNNNVNMQALEDVQNNLRALQYFRNFLWEKTCLLPVIP